MINFVTFKKKFKDVSLSDLGHLFLFIIAFPCSYIFKLKHKNFWLICEDKMEARDNGFALFKYIKTKHPEQKVYYAIDKKSPDYGKVSALGSVISYGTFKHWLYYLAAKHNISPQKGGKPNAAVCYLLEISGLLKNSRIFLQHGIIKDDMPWLYYQNTRFALFLCGAKPEYDFVSNNFGYPKKSLKLSGLARFDFLHEDIRDRKLILVMPTWRNWFCLKSNNKDGKLEIVNKSFYFKSWQEFLNSSQLHKILEDNNLHLLFYPHRNMQPYLDLFKTKSDRIVLAHQKDFDVQDLLRRCSLLITDYSSVFFDVVYMKKPVLFYQFDTQEFRARQYAKGYFDYGNNPFGIRYISLDKLLIALEQNIKAGFKVSEKFLRAHKKYFPLYDTQNCERIYREIENIK